MVTEAEARERLRCDLLASRPSIATVYEFWVPQSNERADVAVIDGTLDGFEIKTERDTLKRLPRQADAYGRVFDRCHAVLACRHVDKALEMLPPWWGVVLIDEGLSFPVVRAATRNDAVDPETLVRLLWRAEVYAALCDLGEAPDPRLGRFRLWEMLLAALNLDALRPIVRDALRRRDPARARVPSRRFAVT